MTIEQALKRINLELGRLREEDKRLRERIAAATGYVSSTPTATPTSGTIVAGNGLTGGGTFPGTVTINVGPGDGIDVSSTDVSVDVTDIIDTNYGLQETSNNIQVNLGANEGLEFSGGAIIVDVTDLIDTSYGLTESGNNIRVNLASPSGLGFSGGALQIQDTIAGAGLGISSKVLSVNTGTGLSISGDSVVHVTGDSGDLHTNYPEHDQTESITGSWTFQSTLTTRTIQPEATDTYDLGTSSLLWRKGWLSELDTVVFAENAIAVVGGWMYICKYQGTVNEDVDISETQIDFGSSAIPPAMEANDFIVFRQSGKVEYMQLVSQVGSGVWNVTRDVDGSGANTWPQGAPYANLGYSGDGRIELNASDTPRIQIITQGSSYNAQDEIIRLGDLDGNWGYSSETWGAAIGEYGSGIPNLTLDATNGIRMRNYTNTLVQVDTAGNLILGQVATNYGNAYWNQSNQRLEFRGGTNGTEVQAYIDTDGSIVAGTGRVALNSDGVKIEVDTAENSYNRISWEDSGTLVAATGAYNSPFEASAWFALDTPSSRDGNISMYVLTDAGYEALVMIFAASGLGTPTQIDLVNDTSGVNYIDMNQDLRLSSGLSVGNLAIDPSPGAVIATDYVRADGGFTTDSTDPGTGIVRVTDYLYALGGIHVGGTSDPGTDNLIVDAAARIGSGLYVGATSQAPYTDDIVADGGAWFGYNANPAIGMVGFTGNLISRKNGINYNVFGFYHVSKPYTHTSWDTTAKSDVSTSTRLDLSTFDDGAGGYVPGEIKFALLEIVCKDSATWGTGGLYFACGPSSAYWYACAVRPAGGDVDTGGLYVVPCDSNGDVWYRINASGTGTMDVTVRVWGWSI